MKASLKWLSEYVNVPADIKELCDRLDLTGTGVEGVERTGEAFDNIVVGCIAEKNQHPDSDHLWVTKVDVGTCNVNEQGEPEPLQIVCGAQNFQQDDRVVVALVGAVLPGDFKIKKSKLRGVASCGMNCSARELGLGADHEGIMILPPDAPIGLPFAEYYGLGDTILDLEITPNRSDCLSITGLARELGALYREEVTYPRCDLAEHAPSTSDLATVEIVDESRCSRYSARVIRNVKIGPSPDWLAERVTSCGARSINNIVDVTNYVMFLLGQPFHAFDHDKLLSADGKAHIIVRSAAEGEKFTTLDGEERVLKEDMTLIATPEKAVALAGVMGGLETEVTEETTTILLETATFDMAHTSRTSRNLGLISESSIRYERGIDDNPIAFNAAFAASLIAEVSGGEVCTGLVDVWPRQSEPNKLAFRIGRFNAMIGWDVAEAEIEDILARLGCIVNLRSADVLEVETPTYRLDLEREIDLFEEVLRLVGMDKVPATLPGGRGRIGVRSMQEHKTDLVHASLRASGLNETMTYSFIASDALEKLRMDTEGLGRTVELLNPMNADQSVMRQTILAGLLQSVSYNQSHGVKNVQLYEIGTVFGGSEGRQQPHERRKVAGILAGAMTVPTWNVQPAVFDFFDGKGVIEQLCRELAIPKLRFKEPEEGSLTHLQPGRAASVLSGGNVLGWVGELHPLAVDAYEADGPVVAFELDMALLTKLSRPARDYEEIPTFPAVTVDVAFVVDEAVTHERLMQCMTSAGGRLLENVRIFDVYRDEQKVGAGKKSLAYALTYRSEDRTLTGEEVDKAHDRLVKKVSAATGAEVRSS